MDLDEDLFADDSRPAVNHGRGRFQPRAKPKPGKEATASVSSLLTSNIKEKVVTESLPSLDTEKSFQPVDIGGSGLTNPVGTSVVNLAVPDNKEPLENKEEQRLGIPILGDNLKLQVGNPSFKADAMRDEVGSIDVLSTEVQGKCDGHSSLKLLTKKADSMKFDLVTSANVNFQPTARSDPVGLSFAALETVGAKEDLKGDEVFANAIGLEVAVSDGCGDSHSSSKNAVEDMHSGVECLNNFSNQSTHGTETSALVDSDKRDGGENAGIRGQSFVDISTSTVCDTAHSFPDLFIAQDPVTCSGVSIFDNDGGIPVDDGRLEIEVQLPRAFPDLDTIDFISEATVAPGSRAGKYKPKPKVRTEEIPDPRMVHPDAVESVMLPPTAQFVPSETECMFGGSVPVLPPEHEFDYSSIDLGDIIDTTTSELPTNEELTNLAETSHAEATTSGDIQPEDVHEIAENLSSMGRKGKASIMSNFNQRSNESSLIGKNTKGGKSSRQLRKQAAVPQLVDEPDDEAYDNSNFTAESPGNNVDEDEGNVDEYRVESKSQKKRASRRSKKSVTENDKLVRKSRKANEASEQSTKGPPKKFPHSTRRKRRRVSKELLETPEDEIDPQKVPLKDLILLAEYRERLASKEAKSSAAPLNQSTENIFGEEDYRDEEDETFASKQGYGSTGDQATCRVQSSSLCFNYQSFMKKTPSVRWSKQETELFYEAVRQFGTDLSMIQQLFPGRTRQQIKLKYKNEERKQPLRLTEALTNRAKDHSHFEKVIEQLQQVAAQKEQDGSGEDSIGMGGEEVEDLATELNDEAGKVEQDKDGKADVAEVHSPPKADEIDDDDDIDIWDSYKSEF